MARVHLRRQKLLALERRGRAGACGRACGNGSVTTGATDRDERARTPVQNALHVLPQTPIAVSLSLVPSPGRAIQLSYCAERTTTTRRRTVQLGLGVRGTVWQWCAASRTPTASRVRIDFGRFPCRFSVLASDSYLLYALLILRDTSETDDGLHRRHRDIRYGRYAYCNHPAYYFQRLR